MEADGAGETSTSARPVPDVEDLEGAFFKHVSPPPRAATNQPMPAKNARSGLLLLLLLLLSLFGRVVVVMMRRSYE